MADTPLGDAILELGADWRELARELQAARSYTEQEMGRMSASTAGFQRSMDSLGRGMRDFVQGSRNLGQVKQSVTEVMGAYQGLSAATHSYIGAAREMADVVRGAQTRLETYNRTVGDTAGKLNLATQLTQRASTVGQQYARDVDLQTRAIEGINRALGDQINLYRQVNALVASSPTEARATAREDPRYQALMRTGASERLAATPAGLMSDYQRYLQQSNNVSRELASLRQAIQGQAQPQLTEGGGVSAAFFDRLGDRIGERVADRLASGRLPTGLPGRPQEVLQYIDRIVSHLSDPQVQRAAGPLRTDTPMQRGYTADYRRHSGTMGQDDPFEYDPFSARTYLGPTRQSPLQPPARAPYPGSTGTDLVRRAEMRAVAQQAITDMWRDVQATETGPLVAGAAPTRVASRFVRGLDPRGSSPGSGWSGIERNLALPAPGRPGVAAPLALLSRDELSQFARDIVDQNAYSYLRGAGGALPPRMLGPGGQETPVRVMNGAELGQDMAHGMNFIRPGAGELAYRALPPGFVPPERLALPPAGGTGRGYVPPRSARDLVPYGPTGLARVDRSGTALAAYGRTADPGNQRIQDILDAADAMAGFRAGRARPALPRGGATVGGRGPQTSADAFLFSQLQDAVNQSPAFGPSDASWAALLAGGAGGGRDGGGRGSGGGGGMGPGDIARRAFWGGGGRFPLPWFMGGAVGGAGLGSIGAMAGLGPEHLVMTGLGVLGSAGMAAGGAATLGAGALGQMAVGGGSDVAVLKSTITDTQQLSKAYQNVQLAVDQYGKGSAQAALAQGQLNTAAQQLGATFNKQGQIMQPGIAAELQLAKNADALNQQWDKQTQLARVRAAAILEQVVTLGSRYTPLVANAAAQNLQIINTGLRPLFSWLEGPQGIGIFNNLENHFKSNLPTAVHAFTQSVEVLLRFVNIASGYTGGFTAAIDRLMTRLNDRSNLYFQMEIAKLVGDFKEWERLVKLLGQDIGLLFRQDAGTGNSVVAALTGMLEKLHEWESSVHGQSQMHTMFEVHKQETLALLGVLGQLVSAFGHFYLTAAPPLTRAMTGIITLFGDFLNIITKLGPVATDTAAAVMLMAKFGVLMPVLGALRTALMGVAEAEGAVAAGEAATGVAGGAGGAAGVAGGAGAAALGGGVLGRMRGNLSGALGKLPGVTEAGAGRLATGGMMLGGGALGFAGGNMAANALGLHGVASAALQGATTGAGLGMVFGPWGAAAGAAVGAGVSSVLDLVFSHHSGQLHGSQFAQGFSQPLHDNVVAAVGGGIYRAQRNQLLAAGNADSRINQQIGSTQSQMAALLRSGPGPRGSIDVQKQFDDLRRQETAELKKRQGLWWREGGLAGRMFVEAMQSVKHPTTYAFVSDAMASLQRLSPVARENAVNMMLDYAQELVRRKQLPANAIGQMIDAIKHRFPELATYLSQSAKDTANGVADAMHLQKAQNNLSNALQQLKVQWGLFDINPDINGQTWTTKVQTALNNMENIMKTTTGRAHRDAVSTFRQLKNDIGAQLDATVKEAGPKMAALRDAVAGGSAQSYQAVSKNFYNVYYNIKWAMDNGLISTQDGAKQIQSLLRDASKAYGGKTPPLAIQNAKLQAAKVPPKAIQVNSLSASQWSGGPITNATGALYQIGAPGTAGHDKVPMNIGGMPIVVGEGEQVAVFNRHQSPILDRALQKEGYGGLHGLFNTVKTPNYMAGGGFVPGYASGGMPHQAPYVYPIPGFRVGRTDMGVDANAAPGSPILSIGDSRLTGVIPNWYAGQPLLNFQLLNGPDAGRYWYVAEEINPVTERIGATFKAGQVVARYAGAGTGIEIGWAANAAGSTLAQGTTGYSEGQVTAAGASFRAFLSGLSRGQIVGGGPGGGQQIAAPQVSGPDSLIKSVVQGALNQDTSMANAWLMAHAPTGMTGPGGSMGPVSITAGNQDWVTAVKQISAQKGWSVDDWLWIVAAESGSPGQLGTGNPRAMNSIGAFGLGQFLPSNYGKYGPGSDPRQHPTPIQEISAMAQYIASRYGNPSAAKAFHIVHNWYAQGGELPHELHSMFATAGRPPYERNPTGSSHRAPTTHTGRGGGSTHTGTHHSGRRHHPIKPRKMPTIRGFKVQGQIPNSLAKYLNEINRVNTQIDDEGNVVNYLSMLWGNEPITSIITDDAGNETVNWGGMSGPPWTPTQMPYTPDPTPTGMIDPSTGQKTFGVDTRIWQIGPLGGINTRVPDEHSDLGIQYKLQGYYNQVTKLARQAQPVLNKIVSDTEPYVGHWDKQGNWVDGILQQRLTRLNRQKAWMVPDRAEAATLLREKYAKLREKASETYAKKSADSSILRTNLIEASSTKQALSDAGIPARTPASWIISAGGTTHRELANAQWAQERAYEVAAVTARANAERAAINDAAVMRNLKGRINYARARLALQLAEDKEREALTRHWTQYHINLGDQIKGVTQTFTTDKARLQALTGLVGGTTGNDIRDSLNTMLDPRGQLQLTNIGGTTAQIFALKREQQALEQTTPTSAAQDNVNQSTSINQYMLTTLQQQAQQIAGQRTMTDVLTQAIKTLPPFGGSFAEGGIVPGPLGEARTVIAHGGEEIRSPGGAPMQMRISIEDNRTRVWVDGVEQTVQQTTGIAARHARRNLPGRGGGLYA